MKLSAPGVPKPTTDIFGKVQPPGPLDIRDPSSALGSLFTVGLRLIFIIVGITVLVYFLWGAYKWITSGGDPEALEKARSRITNAFLGIIVMVVVIAVFGLISSSILGLVEFIPGAGFKFKIPTIPTPTP